MRGPVPEAAQLSTQLTDTFKVLTETLTGIKDVPSAEAALPKLQDIGPKLEAAKAALQKLGEAGKATIKSLVQSSQAKLKDLVDKVLAIPGVGDKIKAVVDTIMAKLHELTV
jgi:endonuclease III